MSDYQYWQEALTAAEAGTPMPSIFVDDPKCGFYRKKNKERDIKGNWKHVGWSPVAVYMDGSRMVGRIGNAHLIGDALNEAWSYFAQHPISEDTYRQVAEDGQPWPDAATKVLARDTGISDVMGGVPEPIDDTPPDLKIIQEIEAAKKTMAQFTLIDSDEQASRALGLKNEVTALAGKLDKYREERVRPHLTAQQIINAKYNPLINEAKTASKTILSYIGKWEDEKRQIARLAQEQAERQRREHERAAAEAAAANKPAPAPIAPAPETNAPAPSLQIAPTKGRKAVVETRRFVTEIDDAKVFAQFVGNAELHALLMVLAQKAVNTGISVPGAVTEERTVVR